MLRAGQLQGFWAKNREGGDPFFDSVVLLMHFEGPNDGTDFIDDSKYHHAISNTDGAPTLSTTDPAVGDAKGVFGDASFGESDAVGIPAGFPGDEFDLNTRLFTMEFRLKILAAPGFVMFIFNRWPAAPGQVFAFLMGADRILQWHVSETGSDDFNDLNSPALTIGTWYAVAVDYDGTDYRMYIDGAMVDKKSGVTRDIKDDNTTGILIGRQSPVSAGNYMAAEMDELRWTMDHARYASDSGYVVATEPFPDFGI